ncbi:hypothetical protein [Sorangium sp. So ce385]|uniref:hypothetical protein n=1 Tax=Sorangium sp. So ce385 TaxID=3133308 RepID=UPI003F5C9B60
MDDEGTPTEGHVLWTYGDALYFLHLFSVWERSAAWNVAIENLVADEAARAAEDHGRTDFAFANELAALKRAQAVVFLATNAEHCFGRMRHFVKMLRADLVAAGRDPDSVPVVFQINHWGPPIMPMSDLLQVLTWPRCDHVQAFSEDHRGAKEALDRAIALYEEMRAGA